MRFAIIMLFFICNLSYSQNWNPSFEERKKILFISKASLYATTITALHYMWYKDYPQSKFHFINDNREWNQMDKIGHLTTSYNIGVSGIQAYKWAGFERKKAIWYGGFSGSLFLTAIEVLDGFSEEWGASPGDLFANSAGSLLCIFEELIWNEQKILLKYSFKPSPFAKSNPELLGNNILEQSLKDYNGQTYWASLNIKSILLIKNRDFPDWLNLSIGYSSNGMINAYKEEGDPNRRRQYLLSFDIDLNKIHTKNRFLNSILHTFGFIKIPSPTLEIRNKKIILHPIY